MNELRRSHAKKYTYEMYQNERNFSGYEPYLPGNYLHLEIEFNLSSLTLKIVYSLDTELMQSYSQTSMDGNENKTRR